MNKCSYTPNRIIVFTYSSPYYRIISDTLLNGRNSYDASGFASGFGIFWVR